jgi:MoaD family protein
MKLEYFATLREVTKKREEDWTLPAPTLRVLLEAVIARYGNRFACWITKDGELGGLAVILVDGRDCRSLQGMDTPLASNSVISIFPPLAGG